MRWRFWKQRKDDAKKTASPEQMPKPIPDFNFGSEEKGDRIRVFEESKEPATQGYVNKRDDEIVKIVAEAIGEWENLQKRLRENIAENKEKVSEELDNLQEKTMDLLNNLASYFEDKQKLDKEAQQKDRESARAEIEKIKKELADRMNEIEANNNKKFSELEAKIDNKLGESKKELSEFEESILKKVATMAASMNVRDRETAEASEKVDEQRKRVDDMLETINEFIQDHKESIRAGTTSHRINLATLELVKQVIENRIGVQSVVSAAYLEKLLKEVEYDKLETLVSKTELLNAAIERIKIENEAKGKETSH